MIRFSVNISVLLAFSRAVSRCPSQTRVFVPAWENYLPGKAAFCWELSCSRYSSIVRFASGFVRWEHFMHCLTRYPFIDFTSMQIGAHPVELAAGYAKWTWMCFVHQTTQSAFGAETVFEPVRTRQLQKHFL